MKFKNIIGVFGLPLAKDGKILLTQRYMPQDERFHLKWQMPGGGMEYGESTTQTLKREIREEIGVDNEILFPHPIIVTTTLDNNHFLFLTYIIQIFGTPNLDNDPDWETADWKWFTREQALKLDKLSGVEEALKQAFVIIDQNDIIKKIKTK